MIEFLKTLLSSLNGIEVKGRANMDILLGCIMAVERMINKIEAEETTGESEE